MTAILLVPRAEWRDRLLAPGVCGARVPTVRLLGGEFTPPRWSDGPSDGHRWPVVGGPALVLAWENAVVPEGMDRLARVLATLEAPSRPFLGWSAYAPPGGCAGPEGRLYFYDDLDAPIVYEENEAPAGYRGADIIVPSLSHVRWGFPTSKAHALATVCAARGMGEVVTIEGGTP